MGVAPFDKVCTYPGIARRLFGACEWNNRMVIAGGMSVAGGYLNDVWESVDGVHWNQLATGAQTFTAREGLALFTHDNRLYITGGYSATAGYFSDVWCSEDGTKWDRVANNAYTARDDGPAFSLNGRIFVVGGDTSQTSVYFQDVWSSPDGTTWTKVLDNYSRIRRTAAPYTVFNNRMHIICGYDGTLATRLSTAVFSADGVNWDITGPSCGLPTCDDNAACVFDNKIVVSGGYNTNLARVIYEQGIFWSSDGEKYKTAADSIGFNVYQHKMVALKNPNRLFLLFGYDGTDVRTDIWMSTGNWQSKP
jgi:hypothetical protein